MDTYQTIGHFASDNIQQAALGLLSYLGIKIDVVTEEVIAVTDLIEQPSKAVRDICKKIEESYLVCSISDRTFEEQKEDLEDVRVNIGKYDQMLVFAVDFKADARINRTEMTTLTRALNRASMSAPVVVVCRYYDDGDRCFALSLCERTAYVQAGHTGEKAGKVNILRGIHPQHPHSGHVRILESMRLEKQENTFEAVYTKWLSVFDNDVLTKQFYKDLQNWYFWALKPESKISFPNDIKDGNDDEKYNPQNIIRLITRLIFVWFLRQKGLVPKELFNIEDLQDIVKDFEPDNFESSTYYRAILQNLFFATLNKKIEERAFVSDEFVVNRNQGKYKIKTYLRHASDLKVSKEEFIELLHPVPFMNNSLFECLDNKEKEGHIYNWDGFSNSNQPQRQAFIPNYLFFAKEEYVDLSKEYDRKNASSTKVFGLLNILKRYNFTIEENTPLDQDVALDPELLGRVFENLLAAYNPETKETVRKSTGSYYTPRPIVEYMVNESLVAYLKKSVPSVEEGNLRSLLSYDDENKCLINEEQSKEIVEALLNCKILDPACGSGAFPMGMLQQMSHLLSKIDANNSCWEKVVMEQVLNDVSFVEKKDEEEREARKREIEVVFAMSAEYPDYARKLYLIENCIYGVDIQSIAVQISRLRFFISLVCEQNPDFAKPEQNYNIKPLPNLEMKFVAANSLIPLEHIEEARELFANKAVLDLIAELKAIRHELFIVTNQHVKEKLLTKDETLRHQIMLSTGEMYVKEIKEKIESKQRELVSLKKDLMETERMSDALVTECIAQDLFGESSQSIAYSPKKRKQEDLQGRIYKVEREIKKLDDSINSGRDKAERLAKQLTDWNPYDQNVSSSFFDAEWMFGVKDGFDIVIANPPYVVVKDDCIYDSFRTKKCYELYAYFFEKSIMQLKDKGTLAFITASLYIKGLKFNPLRAFLKKNTKLLAYRIEGDKVFENVGMPTSTIILIKESNNEASFENLFSDNNVILKMEQNVPLKKISRIMRGYEIGRKAVSPSGEYRILTGSNVEKWSYKAYSYISDEVKSLYNKDSYFFTGERIYIRETGSFLTVLCLEEPLLCTRSLYSIKIEDSSFNYKYVVAILNSSLIQYYYSSKFKSDTELFPKIRIAQVKEIPVPKAPIEIQCKIIMLVDLIMKKKKNMESIDIEENAINFYVYHLYGLTYDEVMVVDPNTKIKKEDYEKLKE